MSHLIPDIEYARLVFIGYIHLKETNKILKRMPYPHFTEDKKYPLA